MIKVEVIENFTLGKFDELKNIVRKSTEQKGYLFAGDIFECTKEMAEYLTNETPNPKDRPFVKVIEIIPEINILKTEEKKKTTKTTKKKSSVAKK